MRIAKLRRAALSIVCSLAVVTIASWTVAAQPIVPSLFVGLGTGTNVGGTVGAGVEVRVGRHVAGSAAAGVWPEALGADGLAREAFDFDVGAKFYPVEWFFAGLNYGIIHSEIVTVLPNRSPVLRKRHGFTFSLGLRTPTWGGLYAGGFAGITSDGEANHLTVFDRRTFMPHFGLIVGYALSGTR